MAIAKAFVELLGLAVKLKARQQSLRKPDNNPFKGTAFYIPETNALVLSEGQVKMLAYKDILVKISEAKNQCARFDAFPLSAQKGQF